MEESDARRLVHRASLVAHREVVVLRGAVALPDISTSLIAPRGFTFMPPDAIHVCWQELNLMDEAAVIEQFYDALASFYLRADYECDRMAWRRARDPSTARRPCLHPYKSPKWQIYYDRFTSAWRKV